MGVGQCVRFGDRGCVRFFDDRDDEAVPATRDRGDHFSVGQRAPESRDALGQDVFGHERVRPDRLHELVFRDCSFVVRHKKEQRIEGFGWELDWSSFTQKLAPREINPVATEAVTTHFHRQLSSWTAAS